MFESLFNGLLVVFGIGMLIFVHEFGHYICARLAGVRVLVFSLGFGKRIWGFKRGGTDYRVALLPIGGYVQVAGEDPTQRQYLAEDDLHSKGFMARLFFFSGGVIMNLVFALIAFPLVFHAGVEFPAPVLGEITPGGAAWEAGLQKGDKITSVNGKETYDFSNLVVEVALAGRKPIELGVERGDKQMTVHVSSQYDTRRGLRQIGAAPAFADKYPAVINVREDSAVYKAGLRDGATLLSINGNDMRGDRFMAQVPKLDQDPDSPVTLKVRVGDEESVIRCTFGRRKDTPRRIGVLSARRRVIGVRKFPALVRLGLRVDDTILDINGQLFQGDGLKLPLGSQKLTMSVYRPSLGKPVVLSTELETEEAANLAASIALGVDEIPKDQAIVKLMLVPTPGGAALAAGLRPGDQVAAVGDKTAPTWDDLVSAVKAAKDGPVVLTVVRETGLQRIQIIPQPVSQADIGFTPQIERLKTKLQRDTLGASLHFGLVCSLDLIKQLYVTLKRMVTGDVSAKNLGGIITISRVSYAVAQEGWARLFWFLAVLSINLAFINVLPIPVLDGGHLMFLLIERVKGSPVSARVHTYSQILGLVFVVALLVFVTYNDILRLL